MIEESFEPSIGAADPECTDAIAVFLHDDDEWSAILGDTLPVRSRYLDGTLVDWALEDAIFAYTDCSFIGLTLQLEHLGGSYDGAVDASYLIDIPATVQDQIGRTYAIHAFDECGACEVTAVVTDR